jgi:hypothetical protein
MSEQLTESTPPPQSPSYAIPIAILVAVALEGVLTIVRLAIPADWRISPTYWLISSGGNAAAALLTTMGIAELVRRLPERLAAGARIAMIGSAVFFALSLSNGLMNLVIGMLGEKGELGWKMQSYAYLATSLVICAGVIVAAGGFARVAPTAIALIVLTLVLMPPPFLGPRIYSFLGSSARYVFPLISLAQLVVQTLLIREAARSSTRALPAEPTAPFALLGASLRARVIAMFVLIGFTVFAVGGRSLGMMKVALVGAPLINIAAFIVFAVAAARAARGLETKLQWMFGVATGATAWCAGVLSMQTIAVYQMLKGDSGAWSGERDTEMAQALGITMPLVATVGVVLALLAVGAHLRKLGHQSVSDSIGPRTTTFVVLMLVSVLIQIYGVPKAKSTGEFVMYGLGAAVCGVIALLVAANSFKRASEATSTTALPTATML